MFGVTDTEVNEPGPAVDDEASAPWRRRSSIPSSERTSASVVLAGSLPTGALSTVYADWTRRLSAATHAPAVIVDASDDALAAAVAAARPFMVKSNRVEAERLLDRPIPDRDAALLAAASIVRREPPRTLKGSTSPIRGLPHR